MTGPSSRRLLRAQAALVLLLFVGYSGYFLCRSNLSVSMKSIEDELVAHGRFTPDDARRALGAVVSLGLLAYAFGKFLAGNLADTRGGRWNLLVGLFGSVVCTIGFALSGTLPLFTLAWAANRAVQSLGWVGIIKLASRWFSFRSYASAIGLISLSYLFGAWASKQFLGALFAAGLDWRQVFWVAAVALAAIGVLCALLIRESPGDAGLPEPESSPTNLYQDQENTPAPTLRALWGPLLRSPLFWLVCLLSLGFTFLREAFNTWNPTFLQEVGSLNPAAAARQSAWFDFWGGISVLAAGFLGDLLGKRGRAAIILVGAVAAGLFMLRLADAEHAPQLGSIVLLLTATSVALLGPYSYLAGALALDLGGKKGSATAAGLIDGIGYLFGGILAGQGVAELQIRLGWDGAFRALALAAAACALVALVYLIRTLATRNPPKEGPP